MIEKFNKENIENKKFQLENTDFKKPTDMEAVLFYCHHIDNPCEAEVGHNRKKNIREFHLDEAEKLLENLTNPIAKKILQEKINEYRK